jgi:hypothetical protein
MRKTVTVVALVVVALMWGSWFLGKPNDWTAFPSVFSMVLNSAIVMLLWGYICVLDFLVDKKVARQKLIVEENRRLIENWMQLRDEAEILNHKATEKLRQAEQLWSLRAGRSQEPN